MIISKIKFPKKKISHFQSLSISSHFNFKENWMKLLFHNKTIFLILETLKWSDTKETKWNKKRDFLYLICIFLETDSFISCVSLSLRSKLAVLFFYECHIFFASWKLWRKISGLWMENWISNSEWMIVLERGGSLGIVF